jgi:glycosyltransferase involved in cell wall biosynthesis
MQKVSLHRQNASPLLGGPRGAVGTEGGFSILIPTYNDNSLELVTQLCHQAEAIAGLEWEIVVGDDGSTDGAVVADLRRVGEMPHCRYLRPSHNIGRAAIRNLLAREARGEWLLLIDGDGSVIADDYLKRFMEMIDKAQACYGGYVMEPGPEDNLRWRYERQAASGHTVSKRQKHPYRCFNVSNLLIRRELMLRYGLDERFRSYGYEDVLLGKQLQEAGIEISHIDAPIGFKDYESNADFVSKTEEGIRTLYRFCEDLRGYSSLLDTAERMGSALRWAFLRLYRWKRKSWRDNLSGHDPSLFVFKLYKLGYLVSLMSRSVSQELTVEEH